MYYIAISKGNFGKNILFWDKKAKAFINKLPNMARDGYKNFGCASDKRVGANFEWSKIVSDFVDNGGERDAIKLWTLPECYVEKLKKGEDISV